MKVSLSKWVYIVLTGLAAGMLGALLQWGHYKWIVVDHTFELYAVLVAFIFTGVGAWAGSRLLSRKPRIIEIEKVIEVEKTVYRETAGAFDREAFIRETGISDRELEVLQLILQGASNQEIADRLFLSLSTVKTHVSNLFLKLGVSRRTQAAQKARAWGLS